VFQSVLYIGYAGVGAVTTVRVATSVLRERIGSLTCWFLISRDAGIRSAIDRASDRLVASLVVGNNLSTCDMLERPQMGRFCFHPGGSSIDLPGTSDSTFS
jgi:hypothetical protein